MRSRYSSEEMGSATRVGSLAQPIRVVDDRAILNGILDELLQNRPVAVKLEGEWKALLPASTAGYPASRRIVDLPVSVVPHISANASVVEALLLLHREESAFGLVLDGERMVGFVTQQSLLKEVIEEARKTEELESSLEGALSVAGAVVFRAPLPQTNKELSLPLPGTEVFGPAEEVFGYPAETLLQHPNVVLEGIYPDDRPLLGSSIRKVAESGSADRHILRFHHPSRGLVRLEETVSIEQEGGQVFVKSIVRDVTDIVLARRSSELQSRFHKILAGRRVGESLEFSFAFLADAFPVDAIQLLIWKAESRGFEPLLQWAKPELREHFSPLFTTLSRIGKEEHNTHAETILKTETSLYVADTSKQKYAEDSALAEHGILTTLAIPLINRDDLKVALVFYARGEDAFSADDRNLMVGLARSLAPAVEAWNYEEELRRTNATLEEKVRQRTYELEILYELAQQLGYTLSYDELLRLMVERLHRVVNCDVAGTLLRVDRGFEVFVYPDRALSEEVSEAVRTGLLTAYEKITGERVELERLQLHISEPAKKDKPELRRLDSVFLVPVIVGRERRTIGLLLVASEQKNAFAESHIRVLSTVANQASISIQRLQLLMRTEQERLERLMERLPEGIVLLDKERRVVLTNPSGRDYLNTLSSASVGDTLRKLAELELDEFLQAQSQDGTWQDVVIEKPERRVFEISSRPISAGPEAGGWVLVIRDVSEERSIAERIHQQERLASVGQLAAGIAHDFNNILTGIIGWAQIISLQPGIPDKVREASAVIVEAGERGARLVKQILDFGRKTVIRRAPLELLPFLKEAVKILSRTIPEDIQITLEAQPGDYLVEADPAQLHQVVTNLAVNARDAMPDGGELRIKLFKKSFAQHNIPFPGMQAGEWIVMCFSDTGTGIPPDVLPRIFEPFFTTKPAGVGTGLGLSQVYGIVKQHDGFIDVKTEADKGTTFLIYFPALKTATEEETSAPYSVPPSRRGKTILLIEDDPQVLDVGKTMLESLGYRVLTAKSGTEAVQTYSQYAQQIDLIITDLVMPGLSGRKLIRALRSINSNARIIISTGYPLGEDSTMVSADIAGVISKPFSTAELSEKISSALSPPSR